MRRTSEHIFLVTSCCSTETRWILSFLWSQFQSCVHMQTCCVVKMLTTVLQLVYHTRACKVSRALLCVQRLTLRRKRSNSDQLLALISTTDLVIRDHQNLITIIINILPHFYIDKFWLSLSRDDNEWWNDKHGLISTGLFRTFSRHNC